MNQKCKMIVSHRLIFNMKRSNVLYVFVSIWLYVQCTDAFEISLNGKEEICLTRKNTTAEKCALKPDIVEMKSLLSEMKNEITKMNTEILQIKEQLNETEVCARKAKANTIYASCLNALLDDSSAENGVYRIKTKSPEHYSNVYCHMASLPGCSGGGWTIVMKIDGNKKTFSYSSAYWSNMKSYSPNDGKTGLDDKETKLETYWSTPFKQLCVGMKVQNSVQFIPISYSANSLYDILAGGKFHSTVNPRNAWKSLYVGSSLQRNCGRQGFNVAADDKYHARVRIGIIGNNENNCGNADSFIGFGAIDASQRRYCGKRNIVNSCGNSAYCYSDNGNKEVKAMGYIFAR